MLSALLHKYWREIVLTSITVLSFAVMMSIGKISQNIQYHNFADNRTIFGVSNFFDVVSNIPFAIFGIIGLTYCIKHRHRQRDANLSWLLFFAGVTVVCFGSAYYHLQPNNQTLVWDRLPMTIGFMALFTGLLTEYVHSRIERMILLPAIILGISSVIYWHYFDDLRFYFWIQLIPLLTIPLVLTLFSKKQTHNWLLLLALVFYLLAKVAEFFDYEIFLISYQLISGHSLKHLLAAFAPLCLYFFIKKRESSRDFGVC